MMSETAAGTGTILVLGASGGVGNALTRQLLASGYRVLGSALDQGDLDRALRNGLDAAELFIADFASADAGVEQVRQVLRRNDAPLAAVISCIGINPCGALETTPLELFRRTMEINTVANLAIYQATLPRLRESKGRFIFVSSLSGKIAFPLLGYYTASKYALEGLADTMRLEAGQWDVPVSLIEPGAIATAMVYGFGAQLDNALAQLDDHGRENYGDYFQQQKAFGEAAHTFAASPDAVAETIVDALEAKAPATRYAVGNAVDLLEKRGSLSDSEMDAMLNELLPGNRLAKQRPEEF